jgi:hypothetical protein
MIKRGNRGPGCAPGFLAADAAAVAAIAAEMSPQWRRNRKLPATFRTKISLCDPQREGSPAACGEFGILQDVKPGQSCGPLWLDPGPYADHPSESFCRKHARRLCAGILRLVDHQIGLGSSPMVPRSSRNRWHVGTTWGRADSSGGPRSRCLSAHSRVASYPHSNFGLGRRSIRQLAIRLIAVTVWRRNEPAIIGGNVLMRAGREQRELRNSS